MKQTVLVTRAVFPEAVTRLREVFDVDDNQEDRILSPLELRERLKGKQGALTTGGERIDAALLGATPGLRAVANIAVGFNNFDLPALTAAGVLATNTPDVLTETTADFGFALLLATARRITESSDWLRAGRWDRWTLAAGFLGAEIHGSTLGIIGMGRIGQAIARRARGFGMQVLYHNRSRLSPEVEADCHVRMASKEALLSQSDHVMLVVPYSPESHHLIGAVELALMKPTATLVNIARGGIVDDAALAAALSERRIFAAGLDVFEGEPRVHPDLLSVPNVVLTPHIASATEGTRRAMVNLAVDNLIAALGHGPHAGRPPCLLNPEVLR